MSSLTLTVKVIFPQHVAPPGPVAVSVRSNVMLPLTQSWASGRANPRLQRHTLMDRGTKRDVEKTPRDATRAHEPRATVAGDCRSPVELQHQILTPSPMLFFTPPAADEGAPRYSPRRPHTLTPVRY